MVKKEICPVCKGNKVVEVRRSAGDKQWRSCHGCNGTGYQIRAVGSTSLPHRG
jgi:DnaJ-class molecular chaperone